MADGLWNDTITLASGESTPLSAGGRARRGRGRLGHADRDAGRGARGRGERDVRGRRATAASSLRPSARSRRESQLYVDWLRRHPAAQGRPEADQIAERLEGGPWRGLELALCPADVADDAAGARGRGRQGATDGARSRPDRRGARHLAERRVRPRRPPDDEARAWIERSADFAAAIGSPVLTIHLYAPLAPDEFRDAPPLDEEEVQRFLELLRRGVPRAASCR